MKEENERRKRLPTPMTRLTKILWMIVLIDLVLLVAVTVTALVARAEYVNAYNGLCIRAEPNTDAEVLEVLPFGEEVTGEVDKGWMKLDGWDGYVKTEHLSETDPFLEMTCMGEWKTTAYTHTGSPCANGEYPEEGYTIACNSLPFGTQVYIAGIGVRINCDRGPTYMPDAWCDIFMDAESECWNYGVQYRTVYLVEEATNE